ncbi:MAG: metal ABC transporter permease [Deltaproteobacteria bacterium]|nr:metal ABC transporter permease [Deltaproteobacteria bacterium]
MTVATASAALGWADFIDALEIYADPMICAAVAGTVLGSLGVFIVLRRMVFVPLAISHAAGFGVAFAFFAHIAWSATWLTPVASGFACGIAATLLLSLRRLQVQREALVGLLYLLTAGAAVLLGSRIVQEAHQIDAILFGIAVAVSPRDLHATVVVATLVLATQAWLRRGLIAVSFDSDGARVQGLPVRLLEAILMLCIGVTIAVTTRALGALPVFALSVGPAFAALAFVNRLQRAMLLAALLGALCGVSGYVAAFFWELPVGATQATLCGGLALLGLLRRR